MSDTESGQEVNLPVSVATRLSQETADRLDDYRDRENMGRSVAVRQLVRDGLDRELPDDTDTESDTDGLTQGDLLVILGSLGLVAWFAGQDPHWAIGVIGGFVAAYGFLQMRTSIV